MIIVKDLHKTFENNHVLRGVNYHVQQGEKIVVIALFRFGKKYIFTLSESVGSTYQRGDLV